MIKDKKNEPANSFNELKLFCEAFGFTAEILNGSLPEEIKK